MKNIQVIDAATNSVYDIFATDDQSFERIFPNGTDVAFIDEVLARLSKDEANRIFSELWKNRVPKARANGIHGILFYELEEKKAYYPTRKDEQAINPDGSRLRAR